MAGKMFKINRLWLLLGITLLLAAGCGKTPTSPEPPPPPPGTAPPIVTFLGKLFFHDLGPGNLRDIFMADLYLVPKKTAASSDLRVKIRFPGANRERPSLRAGISRLREVEVDGRAKDRAVVNLTANLDAVDLTQYGFILKNLENLTEPESDDSAVDVNSANWIVYVKDPDGPDIDPYNTQIVYLNLDNRIRHQLTPINGEYDGHNADPQWKSDRVVSWVNNSKIVEVDLDDPDNVDSVLPDWHWPQYDPVYSPDGTRLAFNTWVRGKKNSYIKYLETKTYAPCLPQEYLKPYTDDNPTWVFSNDKIVGHIFMPKKGRIYTRNLESGAFAIITDGEHDFRYVTPLQIWGAIYFIFADFENPARPKLWVSNETGTDLRKLNQHGNEAVYVLLGLPIPQDEQDLERVASLYALRFND